MAVLPSLKRCSYRADLQLDTSDVEGRAIGGDPLRRAGRGECISRRPGPGGCLVRRAGAEVQSDLVADTRRRQPRSGRVALDGDALILPGVRHVDGIREHVRASRGRVLHSAAVRACHGGAHPEAQRRGFSRGQAVVEVGAVRSLNGVVEKVVVARRDGGVRGRDRELQRIYETRGHRRRLLRAVHAAAVIVGRPSVYCV